MIILLVLMRSPSILCMGAMCNFSHLSIARLNQQTEVSGMPMTTKIASMRAARTCSIFSQVLEHCPHKSLQEVEPCCLDCQERQC